MANRYDDANDDELASFKFMMPALRWYSYNHGHSWMEVSLCEEPETWKSVRVQALVH